ncbi:hypothetical protein ACKI10_43280 [Streptomyces galilaeus]|uniref:C2H2-type domain-containing protein n=1 Tax=Streptomyces galilaeus TaxID=33899 RepID=A0ABW9J278_STRGJ
MTACTICPGIAPDGQHACRLCADEIRGWLAELPGQARLLAAEFLAPGTTPQQGRTGGTGRAHSPVPVDLRVLALLGPGHPHPVGAPEDDTDRTVPIWPFLAGWAGHLAYNYPAVRRDRHGTYHTQPCEQAWSKHGHSTAAWCAWLTSYLPYALSLPLVAEFHEQLGDLIHRIRDLTHATPHHHPQTAPCPRCDQFALAAIDGRWGITCTACRHHLEPLEYEQHAAAVLHAHQSAAGPDAAAREHAGPFPLDKIAT